MEEETSTQEAHNSMNTTSASSAVKKQSEGAGRIDSSRQSEVHSETKKFDASDKMLRAPYRSRKRKQVLGRGYGSGRGGTSTRGHKGHRSRTGFKALPFFEGGQMPLARRLPKVGFTNSPFKKHFKVVSLRDIEARLTTGDEITRLLLKEKRLFKGKKPLVKLTNKHKLSTLSKKFKVNLKEIHLTLAARKVLESSGSQIL